MCIRMTLKCIFLLLEFKYAYVRRRLQVIGIQKSKYMSYILINKTPEFKKNQPQGIIDVKTKKKKKILFYNPRKLCYFKDFCC